MKQKSNEDNDSVHNFLCKFLLTLQKHHPLVLWDNATFSTFVSL